MWRSLWLSAATKILSEAATRLDVALVERGLCDSRSRAQALIKSGLVLLNGNKALKASADVLPEDAVELAGADHPWVSRGGLKLAKAIAHFNLNPKDVVAIDVGASTGGFTDVLLSHGARKVYAVDVGQDQLVAKLRDDSRVINFEKTNARDLTSAIIPEPIDWVVCDASFISLTLVLPAALALAKKGAQLVALIKPQFEVGKGRVGKGGVVKDPALHDEVCQQIKAFLTGLDWQVEGLTDSPILGPAGNKEFLITARRI